jgi:hypothetical protein
MSWRTRLSNYDPDTLVIVEIAGHFLKEYFHHSADESDRLLTRYFESFDRFFDESFVRHELSWALACAAHYTIHLGGERGNQRMWEKEQGFLETPPDALEYMREHYWNRDRTRPAILGPKQ